MDTMHIYLCGGMGSLSIEEQKKWRDKIINSIKFEDYHYEKKPVFFDPTKYYGFEETHHKSEREVMEFDLNALRNSDLVIVNFNDPKSTGMTAELAVAKEHGIPVVGINEYNEELHPWLIEFTTRMCKNVREAVDYTVEFFLN